jgi:hypothetical protein
VARAWTISGVGEPTREAVTAAAQEAGMPLGQWVEQAMSKGKRCLSATLRVG